VGFSETTNGAQAFIFQNGGTMNLGSQGNLGSYAFGINQQAIFTGTLTAYVHDNYNFSDPGIKSTRTPFATVPLPNWIQKINEGQFRPLELHGYAKPFDVDGNVKMNVEITAQPGTVPAVQKISTY